MAQSERPCRHKYVGARFIAPLEQSQSASSMHIGLLGISVHRSYRSVMHIGPSGAINRAPTNKKTMKQLLPEQLAAFVSAFPLAKHDEPMSAHTYLKIGGVARFYLAAASSDELITAVNFSLENNIPFAVIGGGSNLLVADDGFEGVVIEAADRTIAIDGTTVKCGPGAITALVARKTADASLTGFEWGVGVPGTIGGATFGNAGCFGGEMKDVISLVETYDIADRSRRVFTKDECHFGYRDSQFKHEAQIILATTLMLMPGEKESCKQKIDDIMSKRKQTQPQGAFTAGCLFKNFDFNELAAIEKLQREDEVPAQFLAAKRIPAGWLIDKLGLKGTTIGQAQVSPVHGNFLVNLGGARAQDVLALSSLVKMKVRDELGILLEDEVQYLGF